MNIRRYIPYKFDWLIGNMACMLKMYGKMYAKIVMGRYKIPRTDKFAYPKVLQLPITYRCNCDCVMCGMRNLQGQKNFTPIELGEILNDSLYKRIESVGVNGGEPFLEMHLEEYIAVLLERLGNLQDIYIISNGYSKEVIYNKLSIIKQMCEQKNVRLHISISMDGIGDIHDVVRGFKGIFIKAEATCDMLKMHPELYDSFNLICTISKYNIENICELEAWAKRKGYFINYNMASLHTRLNNEDKYLDFSVLTDDKCRQLCQEFFYGKFFETFSETYYAIYYFLRYGKRISQCNFHTRSVTITPDGGLAYCATFSKCIGDAKETKSKGLFIANLKYRQELCNTQCTNCSHYSGGLTLTGQKLYIKEIMKRRGNPFWD